MENKLISCCLSQTPKQRRREGRKPPPPPPLEAPVQGGLLRVTSKARSSVYQLRAGCRALQCSREKSAAQGQSLNKYLCQLCPFPCPKQGICIKPSQAQDVPWGQPPGREFPCLRWGSQAVRLGWITLTSEQSNQHRSVLVLTLCHSRALELLLPF